jgi:hypothetical protein
MPLWACGGRLIKTDRDGDDGSGASSVGQGASTGSGAQPGRAGSASNGASSNQGGASTGTAGAVSAGGAVSTAGTSAVCPDIPCGLIPCGSDSHMEVLPGQCCPTCVMDTCEDQRIAYERMREQLLEKYRTLGCMTHQDCGTYFERNACVIGCGVVVPTAAFEFLVQNLNSFAAQTCAPECSPQPWPCEQPGAAFCVNGSCQ